MKAKLDGLPDQPGIYLLKDDAGKIIYVGKAANLRKRVSSHFRAPTSDSKELRLREVVCDFDFIVTNSETEALVLECSWIKRAKPTFNIRFADDKSYPYVKVTTQDLFPLVMITRRFRNDGARYYGPYGDVGALRRTVKYLRRTFPIRDCYLRIDESTRVRPCLEYHIRRCAAPCYGLVSPEEYNRLVEGFRLYIEGRQQHLLDALYSQMREASSGLEYERAAVIRDRIRSLERTVQGQQVVLSKPQDLDAIGAYSLEGRACVQLLNVREGKLVDEKKYFLHVAEDDPPSAVVSGFMKQYYGTSSDIPPRILLPCQVEDARLLEHWLHQKTGRRPYPVRALRGDNKRLVEMAMKNAKAGLVREIPRFELNEKLSRGALKDLRENLQLPAPPRHIEAFDISSMKGGNAVGSMVVFHDGEPAKNDYRRFKIKTVKFENDYAMMHEVVSRRYHRVLEEKKPLPDLVLIDGGAGHLEAAKRALHRLGLDNLQTVGLAKRLEQIHKPGLRTPLSVPTDSKALYLLQRVRDEAHRFAVSYHRKLRAKNLKASILDEVPSLGEKRRRNLLQRYCSIENMKRASLDELAAVRGMTKNSAVILYEHLHRATAT